MDAYEAARRLGVAEHEVVDIRAHAGWWEAHHHDMASHDETWRRVAEADTEPDLVPDDAAVDRIDGDVVPDGTITQILEWVGDDPDRAALALEVEEQHEVPRSTLVAVLEKVAG